MRSVKHGHAVDYTKTRLLRIWTAMKQRCTNPKNGSYSRYGGRGVTVCSEWASSFMVFADWAMTNGYSDDLQIDRIDNNCGYAPDNCRWATPDEQVRNRRCSKWITMFGETKLMQDWGRDTRCVVQLKTFQQRMKLGWDAERALTSPSHQRKYRGKAFLEGMPHA